MAEETGIKKDKRCFGTALFFKWCHCEERKRLPRQGSGLAGNDKEGKHLHPKPHRNFDICYRKSAPGGDLGRVALGAGANNSTPPRAASLGTFLAGQESTAAGRHRKYRCAVRLHTERKSKIIGLQLAFCRIVSWVPPEGVFLVSARKTRKNRHRGGAVCLAPAIQAALPYVPHPAAP